MRVVSRCESCQFYSGEQQPERSHVSSREVTRCSFLISEVLVKHSSLIGNSRRGSDLTGLQRDPSTFILFVVCLFSHRIPKSKLSNVSFVVTLLEKLDPYVARKSLECSTRSAASSFRRIEMRCRSLRADEHAADVTIQNGVYAGLQSHLEAA